MSNSGNAGSVSAVRGKPVVSLATGNKLGILQDAFVNPTGGGLSGLSIAAAGETLFAAYTAVHSFGRDAVMVTDEGLIAPLDSFEDAGRAAKNMVGAKVLTESGEVLGQLSDIYLSLDPPPAAIYQIRRSWLDGLLGRELYIPAAAGIALSDDSQRLVVADIAAENAARGLNELTQQAITVRSYTSAPQPTGAMPDDEDETVVRQDPDGDETVVRLRDDDDTVVRLPRKAG